MRKILLLSTMILSALTGACVPAEESDGEVGSSSDIMAPATGNSLQAIALSSNLVHLQWVAANDEVSSHANLSYKIVKAPIAAYINSVNQAGAAPANDIVMNWEKNITTFSATGLDGNTDYAFAILVRDEAGNQGLYRPVSVTTPKSTLRIFTTAAAGNAALGSIADADDICQNDGNRPTSAVYKALLVDGVDRVACTSADCNIGGADEHVDWVLRPSADYIRTDGTTVGTTNDIGLLELPLTNSIAGGASIWTGLQTDWNTSANTCNGWTAGAGFNGNVGSVAEVDGRVIAAGFMDCGSSNVLICVEQP